MTPPTWRGKSGGLSPKVRLTPFFYCNAYSTRIHGRLYTRQYADDAPAPTRLLYYYYPRG
jgi:hypothetical protein